MKNCWRHDGWRRHCEPGEEHEIHTHLKKPINSSALKMTNTYKAQRAEIKVTPADTGFQHNQYSSLSSSIFTSLNQYFSSPALPLTTCIHPLSSLWLQNVQCCMLSWWLGSRLQSRIRRLKKTQSAVEHDEEIKRCFCQTNDPGKSAKCRSTVHECIIYMCKIKNTVCWYWKHSVIILRSPSEKHQTFLTSHHSHYSKIDNRPKNWSPDAELDVLQTSAKASSHRKKTSKVICKGWCEKGGEESHYLHLCHPDRQPWRV